MRASLLPGGLSWPRFGRAQPLTPALTDYVADALVRLIEATRERAIADGVRPVPAGVQRGLLGFFPATLLHGTRFAVAPEQPRLTLPSLAFGYGHADAITLGDVILFRRDHAAQTDLVLWAHELTHVVQYQRWGIQGFAERYVRDHDAVEREARDNAARFRTWANSRK
jgi:hypothetical protein